MKTRELWYVIVALVALNILTALYFMTKSGTASGFPVDEETVATVGKSTITREEWLKVLESRYGEDTLRELVNQEVISHLAKKYDVKVPKTDVERELRIFQTTYGGSAPDQQNMKSWKKQIELSLLLEELLTKDAVVSEAELKSFYGKNKSMYEVPAAVHLSHIIVKTSAEAKRAIKELKEGSDFATLARERSIDEFTAAEGGELGFIQDGDERFPEAYITAAAKLKTGEWSSPIETEEGYAIIKLHDRLNEKKYTFKEVKREIRRQIALAQLGMPPTASTLWDEAGVEWFYGK
ncbi:peptidylprolyl isomerase [Neobacillus notoginsengisoli]|uniref:peptidylprolyl isomerase n=1 Tax=Neobacillus notoginsengisoli TaxID=1578198 RepID=A0A417YGC2_9BACI|nr:peptidyl-prolyl cis-trans isomerase [Neobacillus notoginsengisoli]RHW31825.1 peptidylprolyl isomerase [Neobacillus notoginsengisoli]